MFSACCSCRDLAQRPGDPGAIADANEGTIVSGCLLPSSWLGEGKGADGGVNIG
jgi:hypothetical protein